MKPMKNRMLTKLGSQAGESIGETLMALLVSALALAMLAGAVSSAARVITRSNATMTRYYGGDRALVERGSPSTGASITVSNEDTSVTQSWDVNYFSNDVFAGTPVVAYIEK